ncbi:MAG TPA: hypothetical protein PLU30_11320 [Verrucomicrobiae bacterium]|nr:hypothetical protein [Verrucomicrobiae bacterium]
MKNLVPTTDVERLLSRRELAARWDCSVETIKRRQRAGILKAIQFSSRLLRYRLSDILQIENDGRAS